MFYFLRRGVTSPGVGIGWRDFNTASSSDGLPTPSGLLVSSKPPSLADPTCELSFWFAMSVFSLIFLYQKAPPKNQTLCATLRRRVYVNVFFGCFSVR
jgi:hypothetical protein